VALLLDSESVQRWSARALEELARETDVDVRVVVIDDSERPPMGERIKRNVLGNGIWGFYIAGRWLARRIVDTAVPSYRETVPMDHIACLSDAERIHCTPIRDGVWNEFPDSITERLADVDVAIRFGFGLVKGDVLTAPKYGVLSYHHGDLREYRGPPTGFWEYVHGRETAGVTVQRLNESIDGGEITAYTDVDIGDAATWEEVQRRLFEASVPVLSTAVENVQDPDPIETPDDLGEYYGTPGLGAFLTYAAKSCRGRIGRLVGG
jgi:hypothetical protein